MYNVRKSFLLLLVGIGILVAAIMIGSIANKKAEDSFETGQDNRYSCIAVEDGFQITFYSNTNKKIFLNTIQRNQQFIRLQKIFLKLE